MRDAVFAIVFLLGGTGLTTSSAVASDRQDDVAVLTEKKVDVWPRLYTERDADGLDEFLADGFKVLEPDGSVRTKVEEIAWLREAPPDQAQNDFLFTIEEIVFAADNVAIVYGHGDSTRENEDGQPCHHNYWSSNTFIRQGGTWKPIFSHISGVTCTPTTSDAKLGAGVTSNSPASSRP
jgi:ketosteroid isomerase-like protein